MAYSKTAAQEHPFRTIVKTVNSGKQSGIYPRVLLLCGKEDFLISWAKNYLKDALVNPACEALDCAVFSESTIDAQAIMQACDTLPLMSERKLVIVDEPDALTAQQPRDMTASEIQALTDYIPKVPETTMLVFCCVKPNKTKSIYKSIAKNGIVYDFTPLDDASLGSWMVKRFAAAGKTADRRELTDFARICGYGDSERNYNLYNLENDLKKIFALYDKQSIGLEDMLAAAQGQAEVNAFKILDCAFAGKKGKAMEILHASIDSQAPSKEMGVVLSFLGLLISQIEIMTEGKERQEEGQNYYNIVKQMGVNEYRYKKAMAACSGKSAAQLRRFLGDALQIEKDMKSGSMDGRLALELFIAKL